MQRPLVIGVFVGGRSLRMGGRPKGLLPSPEGPTLVERAVTEASQMAGEGAPPRVVLVGDRGDYAGVCGACPRVGDDPRVQGPLGGFLGLLGWAAEQGAERVVCVACDQPRVDAAALGAVVPAAGEVGRAARGEGGYWEPFPSGWWVAAVLARWPERARAWQGLIAHLGATPVRLPREAWGDWDTPADLASPEERVDPGGVQVPAELAYSPLVGTKKA